MMKKNLTWCSFLFVFLTITGHADGSDEKTIYLHCLGDDWDYQVSIIGQPGQQSVRYKLQDINSHPSFGYQEGVLTEYSITDDLIAYTENEDEYLVSRVDGTFTRNREILSFNCIETDYDIVAASEAAEAAKQERQQKAEAEWDELAAEEAAYKKFKKGKISKSEYEEFCLLHEEDDGYDHRQLALEGVKTLRGDDRALFDLGKRKRLKSNIDSDDEEELLEMEKKLKHQYHKQRGAGGGKGLGGGGRMRGGGSGASVRSMGTIAKKDYRSRKKGGGGKRK